MSLMGNGALMIWHDIEAGCESDYEEWHSKEHMLERVGVPGFLRGHRGRAISGSPQYINWYEVENLATLTSAPYLERLNNPTPWSQGTLGYFRGNNRTLCRVVSSLGDGVAGFLLSVQITAAAGRSNELGAWLSDTMPSLIEQAGVVSAHYLEGDMAASQVETTEKSLREGSDAITDRVVLAGGYDPAALTALRDTLLSSEVLAAHGALEPQRAAVYQLLHCVAEADLHTVTNT